MRDGQGLRGLVVGGLAVGVVAVIATGPAQGQTGVPDGEWHHFGRDGANTKYSPLDEITAENFTDLEIAWRWTSLSRAVVEEHERIDFTPELRAEAIEIAGRTRFGPLFSPPVLRGAEKPFIQVPGAGGGANWQGAAVDPETGRLFISSSSTAIVVEVIEFPPPATIGYFTDPWGVGIGGPQGLPLFKPPYKRVTAFDLNTGDRAWMQPHGDGPRNHPALVDLNLPPLGGGGGITSGPLVTPTLLIMNHGGRDYENTQASSRTISAYDKDTGEHLGSVDLPASPGGNPVTFLHEGTQYLVVAVGSGGRNAELLALTLP